MNYKIDIKLNFFAILLIVNIVLKLLNVITWSWWIVLWPLWASLIITAIVLIVFYITIKRRKW